MSLSPAGWDVSLVKSSQETSRDDEEESWSDTGDFQEIDLSQLDEPDLIKLSELQNQLLCKLVLNAEVINKILVKFLNGYNCCPKVDARAMILLSNGIQAHLMKLLKEFIYRKIYKIRNQVPLDIVASTSTGANNQTKTGNAFMSPVSSNTIRPRSISPKHHANMITNKAVKYHPSPVAERSRKSVDTDVATVCYGPNIPDILQREESAAQRHLFPQTENATKATAHQPRELLASDVLKGLAKWNQDYYLDNRMIRFLRKKQLFIHINNDSNTNHIHDI